MLVDSWAALMANMSVDILVVYYAILRVGVMADEKVGALDEAFVG